MESEERASASYPVTLEARAPAQFDRVQVLVRLLVLSLVGVVHQTTGGLFGALYVALPVLTSVLVLQKGGARFLSEDGSWLVRVIEWVVSVYAYLLFVTDRFPLPSGGRLVKVAVGPAGTPTPGGAVSRLFTSLPHAVILCVLGVAAAVVGFVAAILILLTGRYPAALRTFQRDVVAWMARLFAYHSSLVEEYPPFSFGAAEPGISSSART